MAALGRGVECPENFLFRSSKGSWFQAGGGTGTWSFLRIQLGLDDFDFGGFGRAAALAPGAS